MIKLPRPNLPAIQRAAEERVDSFLAGRFLRSLAQDLFRNDVFGIAAEMAYRFLFSLFPLILVLIASLGFLGRALGLDNLFVDFMDEVEPFLPEQVAEIIRESGEDLFVVQSLSFLVVGIGGAWWGAAGGVNTMIKGLNRIYGVRHKRPFYRRQALSMLLTLTLPLAALTLLALALISHHAGDWLGEEPVIGPIVTDVVPIARWPVLVLLLTLAFTLLYHILPNLRMRYVHSIPGAAFATIAWIALTEGFNIYLDNFADYEAVYGAFGIVIAFMLWLYFVGVILLTGGAINAQFREARYRRWRWPTARPEPSIMPPEVHPGPN